jgi:hypothetical protein
VEAVTRHAIETTDGVQLVVGEQRAHDE